MGSTNKQMPEAAADSLLDITGDVCPMTFVRIKLLMERLEPGRIVEIRLLGEEPLRNVPRQLNVHGHEILSFSPVGNSIDPYGEHRLMVRKR